MIKPKFNIGQRVCSSVYGISDATVIGINLCFETIDQDKKYYMSVEEYLKSINGCDYDIVYSDNTGFKTIDCFSEEYLESIDGE